MRRVLLLIAIYIFWSSTSVVAQERVPAGCFVTDEERVRYSGSYSCSNCPPPSCFNEERRVIISWNPGNGFTEEQIRQLYGFQFGSMVLFSFNLVTGLEQCDTAFNNLNANHSSLGSAYNTQLALVRRLRKACGSKCRRIK
jgi:hypothetical protein